MVLDFDISLDTDQKCVRAAGERRKRGGRGKKKREKSAEKGPPQFDNSPGELGLPARRERRKGEKRETGGFL